MDDISEDVLETIKTGIIEEKIEVPEKKVEKNKKSQLREIVFKMFFSSKFGRVEKKSLEYYLETNGITKDEDKKHIKDLLKLKEEKADFLKEKLVKYLKTNWEYNRISTVKKATIELAILEMTFLDLPYKIAINEAVELAKEYENEEAAKFVNGLLASYVKDYINI